MVNIIEDYVKVNPYTRPGMKRTSTKAIIMHYTATPGANAKNERDYFNGTCITQGRYASAHYFVDDKEARLIMPENEVAYHAHDNNRCYISALAPNANLTAIGVEMCIDKSGKITDATFENAAQLVAQLVKKYGLTTDRIYRHYDITGKNCPAPWVSDSSQLPKFRARVKEILNGGSKVVTAKKDTKKYRLMTGTFPTKTDLHAAAEKLKKATGWAVYEKESDGLRLMTGTFTGKAEAEQAAAKVKKLFGWVVYVKEA